MAAKLREVEVMKPMRGYDRFHDITPDKIPFRKITKGMVFKINGIWYESHGKPFKKDGVWRVDCEPLGVKGEERSKCGRIKYESKAMRSWQKENQK